MQNSQIRGISWFSETLDQNTNTEGCKQVIRDVAKAIEQRTFWYFTSDEAGFLNKVYDKQLDREVLKKRIQQITTDQMNDVMNEIMGGTLKKMKEEEEEIQMQLGVTDFYDELPDNDERAKRGRQKIREINEDFKKYKEEMEQKKRLIQSRKHQKEALEAEFRKSLEKQKREEHRAEIRKHIENLKKKDNQRKEDTEKFKAFMKEYKKAKPLHLLMEEVYKQKVVLPQLQQSRKKLESLSHKKKPTLQEINDHERLYLEQKSNRPEKNILLNHTIDVSYKSNFYKSEEEKQRERKEFQETGPTWDFLEKQKRYSQFVKDKRKPKISSKLKQSLEETIKQSHVYLESPDRSRYLEVGKNYLEYMRGLEKRRTSTPSHPVETIKESRYFNYLDQLKSRSEHHQTSRMDWEKDMRDRTSSKLQKREKVLMKSKQLQEKAMRDEKLVSHYNYDRAEQIINKKKEIDQTLLSSIKAKVAVLRDARSP